MKALVLAVALAFSSLSQAATMIDMGDCKSDQSSKSDQGRSVDVSVSTWGLQALGASNNPQMRACTAILSKPILRPGRWSEDSDDQDAVPDYFPATGYATVCFIAASKATDILVAKLSRNGILPPYSDPKAQSVVSSLPFSELLAQAQAMPWITKASLTPYRSTSNLSWSWSGTDWLFSTDNGTVSALLSGRPWFDADHVEGRKVTYKQATSASSSSGFATSHGCQGKPY
jgi:hypothetical protein